MDEMKQATAGAATTHSQQSPIRQLTLTADGGWR